MRYERACDVVLDTAARSSRRCSASAVAVPHEQNGRSSRAVARYAIVRAHLRGSVHDQRPLRYSWDNVAKNVEGTYQMALGKRG